ncbi:MAG: hypothetical protein ACYTBJ_16635, partial [Planctomycetota bacterium]
MTDPYPSRFGAGQAGIAAVVWLMLVTLNAGRATGQPQKSDSLEKLPYRLDGGGPSYRVVSLEFEGPFPKLPRMMMVYRVKEPNVTEGYARGLAQKHFNMPQQAELMRSNGMGPYWLKSTTHIVKVDPLTGFLSMRKAGKWYSKRVGQYSWPSREECRQMAVEYMTRSALSEPDAYFRGICDNADGGYKSWGAGGDIIVEIGPGGEVVEVRRAWQELIPYKPYPVKMPEQARDELRNRKGVLMHGSRGKVEEITFRYYTSSDKQEYVQPIYYFDCNGPEGRFYGVVPAIKDEYLSWREQARRERRRVEDDEIERLLPEILVQATVVSVGEPNAVEENATLEIDHVFKGSEDLLGQRFAYRVRRYSYGGGGRLMGPLEQGQIGVWALRRLDGRLTVDWRASVATRGVAL